VNETNANRGNEMYEILNDGEVVGTYKTLTEALDTARVYLNAGEWRVTGPDGSGRTKTWTE
jgi:hypothetical protein